MFTVILLYVGFCYYAHALIEDFKLLMDHLDEHSKGILSKRGVQKHDTHTKLILIENLGLHIELLK